MDYLIMVAIPNSSVRAHIIIAIKTTVTLKLLNCTKFDTFVKVTKI